ncbi:MAG TPA: FG-GAP-like repeat-containing protein [Pyrinomonadaceae bacterium]|nr:FG-GAP-like repeat-containing protein [Pyrinomonadaceae bacterium]
MKKILMTAIFVVIAVGTAGSVCAQKVKLRSKITPACTQVRASAGWRFADLFGDGNLAVLGSYGCNGVFIFDVSNPDAPVLRNWYNPAPEQQFLEAIVIGNRGYFGSGIGGEGVHIVDLTNPASPVLLGKVNATSGGGYPTIHEMMVFDQGGSRYLLENSNSTANQNLKIIDITNPAQPVLKWDFASGTGGWIHAMHIRGTRAYFSAFNNSKVDIYNLANLASQAPALLGSVNIGSTTNHSSWTNETGQYLYSARETSNGDVRVYDVQNPAQPLLIRSVKAADLNINAITPHNPVVMGNRLYVAWYQAGTQVFDITDPTNPVRVGQYDSYQPEFAPPAEELRLLDEAEPWDMVCGSANFSNALPNTYGGNWAVYPFLGEDRVLMGDLTAGLLIVDASRATQNNKNNVSDFDGDAKTDFSTFRPATGDWLVEKSTDGTQSTLNWGLPGDIITPGDYDGDGKTDNAIFRPSTGVWWFVMSSNGSRPAIQFGLNGDVPVPADYDADGKTDIAVWRPSNGVWYINQSTLGIRYAQWGGSGDKVFTGDYEGDGKADLVVWRPSNGVWYVLQSSSSIPLYFAFGTNGDKPLFADFDGDARSDLSVYRPSNGVWYGLNSTNGAFTAYQFGIAEDMPVPADYDGDGKCDIAVFRPSTDIWYRLNSSNGGFVVREFGTAGDRPSPSSVQPQ